MNRLNLDTVARKFEHKVQSSVTTAITDSTKISSTVARIVVQSSSTASAQNKSALLASINNLLGGEAHAVEGSFRNIPTKGLPSMVGFIAVNKQIRTLAEAANMRVIASNMLMDDADKSLWQVSEQADGSKVIVRDAVDNLASLVETASTYNSQAPKLHTLATFVNTGDFVSFVDPVTGSLNHGYVLATDISLLPSLDSTVEPTDNGISVLTEDAPEPLTIPLDTVIESVDLQGEDAQQEVAAPVKWDNKAALREYYKTLYSYAPEYYSELKTEIDNHAAA